MCCTNGGLLVTSGTDPDTSVRALRVLRFERAGVDLAATPVLGELRTAQPRFYHRLVLGEVTGAELAAMARQLDYATGVSARTWATTTGPGGAA